LDRFVQLGVLELQEGVDEASHYRFSAKAIKLLKTISGHEPRQRDEGTTRGA